MDKTIKYSAVILNYNTFQDTISLVRRLQNQTVANRMLIVVVDNASPNNSYKFLKPLENEFNNVVVLQTGKNLGYAKGNNFGLKYLDENIHPEYVAILNNDVELPNDSFEKMVLAYEQLEEPAIIAPKQLNTKGEPVTPYRMNSYVDDCLNLFYLFKLFHKRNALKWKDNTGKRAMKVELIPGSYMFSSFARFKEMGFFYPNTFLFVEERFVAMEAQKRGCHNYILLDETYIHAHSKTINKAYQNIDKFKLLYDGWLEFTRVHRKNGILKAAILKPLMKLSLYEMKTMNRLRRIIN